MKNTDIIAWFVEDGVGSSKDLYSKENDQPDEDTISDIMDELGALSYNTANKMMTFVTRRKLDTGDSAQDYVFRLDTDNVMCYAHKTGSSIFSKHDKWGLWSLKIESTGEIGETDINLT